MSKSPEEGKQPFLRIPLAPLPPPRDSGRADGNAPGGGPPEPAAGGTAGRRQGTRGAGDSGPGRGPQSGGRGGSRLTSERGRRAAHPGPMRAGKSCTTLAASPGRKRRGINGSLRQRRPRAPRGRSCLPQSRERAGRLARRRTTFPPRGKGTRGAGGGGLRGDQTEVTIQNSFLVPHNPAPWDKPSETHGLKE